MKARELVSQMVHVETFIKLRSRRARSYFNIIYFKADGRCLGFRDKEVQGTCLGMRDKEVKGYMSRNA